MIEVVRWIAGCLWGGIMLGLLAEAGTRFGLVGFGLSMLAVSVLAAVGFGLLGIDERDRSPSLGEVSR